MSYNRFNMRPSLKLHFNEQPRSTYIGIQALSNQYFKRSTYQLCCIMVFFMTLPYITIQSYRWLDRLPIWERRLTQRREKKMAYDFMIKTLAEKERDIIEEFSDY